MVHDAREDLLQVELAADVGRDAPQRLGPVKLGRGLRAQPLRVHRHAELAGDGHEERLQLAEAGEGRVVGSDQDAPGTAGAARDGHGQAGREALAEREPIVPRGLGLANRAGRGQGPAGEPRQVRRPAEAIGALAACGDG